MEGNDNMAKNDNMEGKRVIHEEYGIGVITLCTYIGPTPIFYIKFDGSTDEIILDRDDPKLKLQDENKSVHDVDDAQRKLDHEKELEMIQADALKEANELKDMDNKTLVEELLRLIRDGAGHDYRRLVFTKKEILRRMDRGENL